MDDEDVEVGQWLVDLVLDKHVTQVRRISFRQKFNSTSGTEEGSDDWSEIEVSVEFK